MKAMVLPKIVSLDETSAPLTLVELPTPEPAANEILIAVAACGVCHTELDEIEGRTPPPRLPAVLGHEVVGYVHSPGPGADKFAAGQRVGVGWIHSSTGRSDENLSDSFRATGRDAPGGYAQFMTVHQNYAYPIPAEFSDQQAAPLLCAGAIGYRALRLTNLRDGEILGLTGFGGSAHLVLQLAREVYPNSPIFVFARDRASREFAAELGADWVGDTTDQAPEQAQAIIDTTPAWKPIVEAMKNLRPGGRLVVNAIRKEDADKDSLLKLSYHEHLWMEREIKSVANITGNDIEEFLPIAARTGIRPEVTTYWLEDANRALLDLKHKQVRGAKVLLIEST